VEVRTLEDRTRDVISLFTRCEDAWVASANEEAEAYLIPLSFAWTGEQFILATPASSITARNLLRAGRVRMAIGPTRDVSIVEGDVEQISPAMNDPIWDVHAQGAGFDARQASTPFALLIITPNHVQTWRNPAELESRDVMLGGQWLCPEVVRRSLVEAPE
jgi:hypothetical protein